MKLHEFPNEFKDLISIVAEVKHLRESAIERNYYIVMLLKNLAESEFAEQCVFKGGTSLSKCYPGSIERFSEDIDYICISEMTVGTSLPPFCLCKLTLLSHRCAPFTRRKECKICIKFEKEPLYFPS